MPKAKIENLISELNTLFSDGEESSAQTKLMQELESHVHNAGEKAPVDPSLLDSLEAGLVEFEGDHPKVAAVLRESLKTLRNIGV